ncbi:MAG: hypothetical protein H8D56_05335 [Planctomycetes bacterium]|nr:hypothetical protein [Planctomycetota bacterium]MBL7145814.1 hypothetical protein [Phycisphaerae bacterium]
MPENIFHNPTLISYIVKSIKETYPEKQISKTFIQKLFYLLSRKDVVDFDYSLYHYGPYSSQVSSELNFAEEIDFIVIDWIPEKGYFISPGPMYSSKLLLQNTEKTERDAINEVAQKYGAYNAIELSIITTALFLKENFGVNDKSNLVEVVSSLKPQYNKERISNLLANTLQSWEIKTMANLLSSAHEDLAVQYGNVFNPDYTKVHK